MKAAPKVREAAQAVRDMIAAGKLLPGDDAPSALDLSNETGTCYAYCVQALRLLADEGTLERGGPGRRHRVARADLLSSPGDNVVIKRLTDLARRL